MQSPWKSPIFAGKTTWNPYGKLKKFTASSPRSRPRLQSARVAWATDWAHWEALEVKPWAAGCSWLIGWKSWFIIQRETLKPWSNSCPLDEKSENRKPWTLWDVILFIIHHFDGKIFTTKWWMEPYENHGYFYGISYDFMVMSDHSK